MYIFNTYLLFLAINYCYSQCIEKTYNFNNLDGLTIDYNNANVKNTNNHLNLLLTKDTGGTRVTLNNKLHYGSVEAMIKISGGSNIISSFILMADNGDEIDFEFVGKDQTVVQTNYFYKGIPIYDKNAKFYNTFKDLTKSFNTYKIIWTRDYYQWLFNNNVLRTLYKNQTNNFPDSPSNIQFGIWLAKNSNWAGNGPNWSLSPFNMSIHHIIVECNDLSTTNPTSTTKHSNKPTKTIIKTTITSKPTELSKTTITSKPTELNKSTDLSKPTELSKSTEVSKDKDLSKGKDLSKPTSTTKSTITSTILSTQTSIPHKNAGYSNVVNYNNFYLGIIVTIFVCTITN